MSAPTMLFVRQYPYFLGGHLKVFDYLGHVAQSGRFETLLYLTPDSIDTSAVVPAETRIVPAPVPADVYFVAGANWRFLDDAHIDTGGSVVLNLIQGFRHLDDGPHAAYLSREALRICVSEPLAHALRSTGKANGPVVTIPNGIDLGYLRRFTRAPLERRIFVSGSKNGELARRISTDLASLGYDVDLCIEMVPRENFLARMAASAVTVAFPDESDGFYLPALEAMALGSALVLPPAAGPAAFCNNGENCVVTDRDAPSIGAAARMLIEEPARRNVLRARAIETAARHSLERERAAFYDVLDRFVPEAAR